MALGNKIQSLREEHSLSQKELANLIGVTTGTIAEWEAEESAPSLTELSRLSKALNVSSDVLLDATTEDIPAPPVSKHEPALVTAPAKKSKKIGWIICTFALIAVAVAVLWISGLLGRIISPTEPTTIPAKPLAFSEDTSAIEAADASVVKIFCYDYDGELAATGSGFVAFDGSTIITNYHVMTSAYTCKISTNQDISYEVSKILCYSKEQDIAILQLAKDTGLQPLTLGDSSIIKKGESVVAIGSPLGIKNTVSTGVLSGRLMEDSMDVLQFTAPISSGSSGGALFDNNGNVIGITYASYINGQNLNLAIPIELAVKLYDTKGVAKSVSSICVEENPYIDHLAKYKNIPSLTMEEFLENYKTYSGQTVKIVGYISSFRSYWYTPAPTLEPKHFNLCYIAPVWGITGDEDADADAMNAALWGDAPYRLLCVDLDEGDVFLPENAQPGDLICWIGDVDYWEFGSDQQSYYSIETTNKLIYSPNQ